MVLGARSDVRVMITDMKMSGGMDSVALARIVDMRWPGVAILVISNEKYPEPGELPEGARFLAKPCAPARLLKEVAALRDAKAAGAKPAIPAGVLQVELQGGIFGILP